MLILGVATAIAAYAGVYLAGSAEARRMLKSPQPELAWLKQEFHLNDAEFERLSQLHEAYLPKCAVRCRQIAELNGQLEQALGAAAEVTPEIKDLLQERSKVLAQCQTEMLEHFYQVSRAMPPEEGRRYLSWVQAKTCLQDIGMADHSMAGVSNRHPH